MGLRRRYNRDEALLLAPTPKRQHQEQQPDPGAVQRLPVGAAADNRADLGTRPALDRAGVGGGAGVAVGGLVRIRTGIRGVGRARVARVERLDVHHDVGVVGPGERVHAVGLLRFVVALAVRAGEVGREHVLDRVVLVVEVGATRGVLGGLGGPGGDQLVVAHQVAGVVEQVEGDGTRFVARGARLRVGQALGNHDVRRGRVATEGGVRALCSHGVGGGVGVGRGDQEERERQ